MANLMSDFIQRDFNARAERYARIDLRTLLEESLLATMDKFAVKGRYVGTLRKMIDAAGVELVRRLLFGMQARGLIKINLLQAEPNDVLRVRPHQPKRRAVRRATGSRNRTAAGKRGRGGKRQKVGAGIRHRTSRRSSI